CTHCDPLPQPLPWQVRGGSRRVPGFVPAWRRTERAGPSSWFSGSLLPRERPARAESDRLPGALRLFAFGVFDEDDHRAVVVVLIEDGRLGEHALAGADTDLGVRDDAHGRASFPG